MREDVLTELESTIGSGSFFSGRGRLLIGGVILLAALIYLGSLAFQSATVYYFTVGELLDKETPVSGETVRINGDLLPDSFQREPSSILARFTLLDPDSGQQMNTVYEGVVPDLFFNPHSQIVAEGQYGSDGVFYAEQLIVKCPSKYVSRDKVV